MTFTKNPILEKCTFLVEVLVKVKVKQILGKLHHKHGKHVSFDKMDVRFRANVFRATKNQKKTCLHENKIFEKVDIFLLKVDISDASDASDRKTNVRFVFLIPELETYF